MRASSCQKKLRSRNSKDKMEDGRRRRRRRRSQTRYVAKRIPYNAPAIWRALMASGASMCENERCIVEGVGSGLWERGELYPIAFFVHFVYVQQMASICISTSCDAHSSNKLSYIKVENSLSFVMGADVSK